MLYDYLLTFDAEVKYFWTTKVTGASVLFIATRYLVLVAEGCLVAIQAGVIFLSAEVRLEFIVEYVTPAHSSMAGVSHYLCSPRTLQNFEATERSCSRVHNGL